MASPAPTHRDTANGKVSVAVAVASASDVGSVDRQKWRADSVLESCAESDMSVDCTFRMLPVYTLRHLISHLPSIRACEVDWESGLVGGFVSGWVES